MSLNPSGVSNDRSFRDFKSNASGVPLHKDKSHGLGPPRKIDSRHNSVLEPHPLSISQGKASVQMSWYNGQMEGHHPEYMNKQESIFGRHPNYMSDIKGPASGLKDYTSGP